jgi:hypothetical protein
MYKIPEKKHYYTMINKYEKKLYSQNGEDGVIDYIFHKIGFTNKIFVEFGFGIKENNSLNLIINHEFSGLFIDGNKTHCEVSNQLYNQMVGENICAKLSKNLYNQILNSEELFKENKEMYFKINKRLYRQITDKTIHFENAFITKKNINTIISRYFMGEIDFLSIDIDGNDCHILDTITCVKPRVVCIEFCSSIGPYRSVTVKYKPNFIRHNEHHSGMYCGGSLLGTTNIMKKKNYSLVAVVKGLNAFYVRNDLLNDNLKILEVIDAWMPHFNRTIVNDTSLETQYNYIKDLDWTEIDNSGNILN